MKESFFSKLAKTDVPPLTRTYNDKNEVHLEDLQSLFKNPKQFMWLFGVELEYHLPPKNYITWPYMIMIVKGEKRLLKSFEISLTAQLPRLAEHEEGLAKVQR